MSTPPGAISSKVANVVIAVARPREELRLIPGLDKIVDRYVLADGGLWVGGRVVLTEERVEFSPNAMNRAAHAESSAIGLTLNLGEVDFVELSGGFPMKIIEVGTSDRLMRIRCYGAPKFADLIRDHLGH